MKVWQKANVWTEARGSFLGWMMRIARNLAIDHMRKRRLVYSDKLPEPTDPSLWSDPSYTTQTLDVRRVVRHAIASLPERQRAALALTMDAGLSNADAGRAMNISEQAMESLLARSRRRLRKALQTQQSDLIESFKS